MILALFEPEIPQNTGTLVRLCKCFNITLGIIEPASFLLSDKMFKRAGMDYIDTSKILLYKNIEQLKNENQNSRVILTDTKATTKYFDIKYQPTDIILMGKESSGVPDCIFKSADISVKIPMINGVRSLNVAVSASIVVSEAMRQFGYNFKKTF